MSEKPEKNSHCSYCGQRFEKEAPWPRSCGGCMQVSYVNPLPVSVLVLPIDEGGGDRGVLLIRRGIKPRLGQLALPGGFINQGESWQAAAARELFEETGVRIDPSGVRDLRVLSAPDGTVLIFGLGPVLQASQLPPFAATDETSERVITKIPVDLAFPLHTQVLREYFESCKQGSQR